MVILTDESFKEEIRLTVTDGLTCPENFLSEPIHGFGMAKEESNDFTLTVGGTILSMRRLSSINTGLAADEWLST